MLVEKMRFLSQETKDRLLLTALAVAKISVFFEPGPQIPIPTRFREKDQKTSAHIVDWDTGKEQSLGI